MSTDFQIFKNCDPWRVLMGDLKRPDCPLSGWQFDGEKVQPDMVVLCLRSFSRRECAHHIHEHWFGKSGKRAKCETLHKVFQLNLGKPRHVSVARIDVIF